MKVKIAKEAGFCFGVKRAMKMAWDELELNSDIYALGPLIHNKQAVQRYEDKGLVTVDTINDIPNDKSVIIRSHGVSSDIYDKANSNNLNIIDTTCPFVKKIHNIVKEFYEKGYKIIIIGDKNHPEIIGINGWCENSALIVKSIDDVNSLNLDNNSKYCLVAQTTLNLELYNEIVNILSKKLDNITFKNTICSATKTRQQAAKELSVDMVVVAPDDPLVLGMVDALEAEGIKAFGPNKAAAIIEGSKVFSKDLMKKYGIPTAKYEIFSNSAAAIEYLKNEKTRIN